MEATHDLMARAQRALQSTAAAALALAPLAMQSAQAATLDTGALVVEQSGAYFYNSSGYFADWRGTPTNDLGAQANPDGSTKFFGTASATAGQFMAHNCLAEYSYCYGDRGVAMVWSGTFAAPVLEGDRLAIHVDFSINVPDVGGEWKIGARIGSDNFASSNSLSAYGEGSAYGSIYEAGTHRIHGLLATDQIQEGQYEPGTTLYWQVFVTGLANAPWGERTWSETYQTYYYPYRAMSLTVPMDSIDVAHVDASFTPANLGLTVTAVPEPGTWLMMALGLAAVGGVARRRR